MNRFDSMLQVAGKVFAFCAIALILAPLAALSYLFFVYLIWGTGWLTSILILVPMLVGVRTVSALVSDRIGSKRRNPFISRCSSSSWPCFCFSC